MTQFIAFRLVPFLAAVWIGGGGLILGLEFISASRAFVAGKAIRPEINAALAIIGVVLLMLGIVFRVISEQQDRGPQLVLLLFGGVSLVGGIVSLLLLWSGSRQHT